MGGFEGPGAGPAVGEGDVGVRTSCRDDGLSGVVEDLAAEVLLCDTRADADLDRLVGSTGTDGWFRLALGAGEDLLRTELGLLVLEDDTDLVVGGLAGAMGCGEGACGRQ